ncbi:MAG: hypothetical protein L0220_12520 [Acidobacteria bacterium]|nr:hypothetical protein [Acidobacteriota bacterium]
MRYEHLVVLAVVFVSFLYSPVALAQSKTNQLQKWEYKIFNSCEPENYAINIDQFGEEGWELVSRGEGNCGYYYFKRPKGAGPKQVKQQQTEQPKALQCSVPLDKAPTIRGLRLGMGLDELIPFVSANQKPRIERKREKADLAPGYGHWSSDYLHRNDLTKEVQGKFVGVMYLNFAFFDGRLVRISVNYEADIEKYPSWTIDEWTAKVSNTFSLPALNNWELSRDKMGRTLKCKDLEIETRVRREGPPLPGLGVYSYPIITITDPAYRQVIEQRAKSDQEKKQREFVF